MIFEAYKPGNKHIDWSLIDGKYKWFEDLKNCKQDPIHHGEIFADIHTRMVCEELIKDHEFEKLSADEQNIAFAFCLMHDIAKTKTSYIDIDGRIKTKNHCAIGAIMAREILYKMGVPLKIRETICSVIKNHLKPFFLLEYDNPKRIALRIATNTRLDLLKIQSNADIKGRICEDQQRILDNIELYWQYCEENNLTQNPLPYSTNHSRFIYFRNEDLIEPYDAFLDKRCDVILMSGLPGSGKDHWIQNNAKDWSVISLDEIRREKKIKPTDSQTPVIFAAKDLAREYLRKKQNFLWNGTNITRQLRSEIIDLFAAYDAYVKIVYVESPYIQRKHQNQNRDAVVPENVIDKMMMKWEIPDLTEAHETIYAVNE